MKLYHMNPKGKKENTGTKWEPCKTMLSTTWKSVWPYTETGLIVQKRHYLKGALEAYDYAWDPKPSFRAYGYNQVSNQSNIFCQGQF